MTWEIIQNRLYPRAIAHLRASRTSSGCQFHQEHVNAVSWWRRAACILTKVQVVFILVCNCQLLSCGCLDIDTVLVISYIQLAACSSRIKPSGVEGRVIIRTFDLRLLGGTAKHVVWKAYPRKDDQRNWWSLWRVLLLVHEIFMENTLFEVGRFLRERASKFAWTWPSLL